MSPQAIALSSLRATRLAWGVREADIRNGFHLPAGIEPVNLIASDPHGSSTSHYGAGMGQIMSWMLDPSLNWKDIESIASEVNVPVIVKGICRADDALLAVEHGASAIIVSNHGGRQLDTAPATIDALPAVVGAIGGRVPVLVDGGIRRGTDVLKALAFGAKAVLVGRPVLWGLATNGERGVSEALERCFARNSILLWNCPDALHSTRSRRICLGETHDQEDGSTARFAAVFWSTAVKSRILRDVK
ncbi:MAG TPA: alpha-hydroxy acid oxidase [Terrimicrobiaceae bacterium]